MQRLLAAAQQERWAADVVCYDTNIKLLIDAQKLELVIVSIKMAEVGGVRKPHIMQIVTDRLIFREFQLKDLQALAPILADPKVMKFSPTGVNSVEQVQERIEGFIDCYNEFGFGKWAVILKKSNQLLGYCGIAVDQIDGKDEKELGYRLDSKYWGQGLATEAASAAVKYGFDRFKLPYVLGIVERENTASVRVLEKIGMQYERQTIFHEIEMDVYRVDAAA
jgi:[ribosomal protein S5]-alanine N-acetyltransferase